MNTTRKILTSGVIAAAIAAGGVVGAHSFAEAQYGGEPPTDESSTTDQTQGDQTGGEDVQPFVGQVDTDTDTDTGTAPGSGSESETAGDDEGRRPGGCRGDSEAIATALGITTDELRQARDAGQSLATIAEAQGVPIEQVIEAIVDARADRLAEEVAEGELTRAEADERLADAEERATEKVNATPGDRGPRPEGAENAPGAAD